MKSVLRPKSIFGKLFVNFLVVILITLIAIGALLSYLVEKYFYGMREFEIKQQAETVANLIHDSLGDNNPETIPGIVAPLAESFDMKIKVLNTDGKVVARAQPENGGDVGAEALNFEQQELEQVFRGNALTKKAFGPEAKRLLVAMPLPIPKMVEEDNEPEEIMGIITLDAPLKGIEDTIAHISKLILISGLGATLIAGFIAFSLSKKIAQPLRSINKSARELAAGNFRSRIKVDGDGEIAQITRAFNYAAAEIEKTVLEQKKLAVLRKNLLDNVSHDFRTPLSAIRGYTELMLDGLVPADDQCKYLHLILDNSKYLDHLLQDLMDLSSIESGDVKLKRESLKVHEVAQRSFDSILTRADSKNIAVEMKINQRLPNITADRDRMHQILVNLLENAVQYTPEDGSIWLRAYPSAEKNRIVFEVEDTGIGIPPVEHSRIWERFYKVDKSRGNAKRSPGLGLAITRQLVELHGGSASVDSRPGRGSTFRVSIPIEQSYTKY
jgi:signal transduction histidine kinase